MDIICRCEFLLFQWCHLWDVGSSAQHAQHMGEQRFNPYQDSDQKRVFWSQPWMFCVRHWFCVPVCQIRPKLQIKPKPGGSRGLDKVESFQDGNSVNSMTTVLATGLISFCCVAIARQWDSSLTLWVDRLTTSDSQSPTQEVFFFGVGGYPMDGCFF